MQSSIVRDGPGTRVNAQNVPIRERKGEKKKGRENKRENAAPSNNGTFSVPPCGKNTLVMPTKCSKFPTRNEPFVAFDSIEKARNLKKFEKFHRCLRTRHVSKGLLEGKETSGEI